LHHAKVVVQSQKQAMQLQPLLQRKLPLAIVNSIANISASVQWLDLSLN